MSEQDNESRLMAISMVARVLGVSTRHLYQMAKNGELPTVRIGSKIMVSRAWVERTVASADR